MTDKQEQVNAIIDEFDFQKVHKVMQCLEWEWFDTGIPSVEDLKRKARELLENVEPKHITATGGFRASMDSENCLELSFVVEEWCGEDFFDEDEEFGAE